MNEELIKVEEPEIVTRRAEKNNAALLSPLPDDVVFEKLYDARAQREAYRLFISEQEDVPKIAEKVGVPTITLLEWMRLGAWVSRRAKLFSLQEQAESQILSKDRMAKRRKAIESQAKSGRALQERAEQMVDRADSADGLKKLGDAMKAGADIEARALGMNEQGSTSAEVQEGSGGDGKSPLVVIIQGGGLPQVQQSN